MKNILPKGIINRVEATCRNFLWDGSAEYRRSPLVAWDKICRPKDEGGLGLKDQETWNKAMVGRLVDLVFEKKDTIWVHWVTANYLRGQSWLEYKPSSNSSWVWRCIYKVKQEIVAGYNDGHWHIQNEGYTPSNCYKWLRGSKPEVAWRKVIWNSWSLPKHKFVGWLWAHEALNTNSKLIMYGVAAEDKCWLCGQAAETQTHLIFNCMFCRKLVQVLNQCTGLHPCD
ncbi:uncharacterized protein LOC141640260 [Silene latifolia]|uniref:uncharacterized protein LOC141640260 n=1 Tax=Silene latifolia TaxID=37657 RepID=UPI003D782BF2